MIVCFFSLGIYMSVRALPKFTIRGEMLIGEIGTDDVKGGGIGQMMKTFSVGGFGGSTVDNEVIIMQSHDVMYRTVRALDLNRSYVAKDDKGQKTMLFRDMPVRLEAPAEYFDSLTTSFNVIINLLDNGKANVKITKGMLGTTQQRFENVEIPSMLKTQFGTFHLMATDALPGTRYRKITVSVMGNEACADALGKQVDIDVLSKLADVIFVDYPCANKEKGKAVVNGLMNEYNTKRLDRLHEASVASIKYYDDRIAEAFVDLQKIENEVADYQRKNDLMGIDSELGILVNTAVGNKQNIMSANYNLAYYQTVLDILRKRLDDDVIIPQIESLNDPNVSTFNSLISERRNLRRSATDNNEALLLLNEKIEGLRNIIIENSEKMVIKNRADIAHQQALTNSAQDRLDEYPDFDLELKNLIRDKEYKNSLYEYLVRSRENSVLQLYSTTHIGFIFQPGYVYKKAGIIKKMIVPCILLFLALFFSACLVWLVMKLSRKVSTPVDVAFMDIDTNTFVCPSGRDGLNEFRSRLTADPERRLLYFAPLGGVEGSMPRFVESLTAIGRSVEVVDSLAGNDEILSPQFGEVVGSALATADYVVVRVPAPQQVADIVNAVDAPGAALVVALPVNTVKRTDLKRILKGQLATKVFAMILK